MGTRVSDDISGKQTKQNMKFVVRCNEALENTMTFFGIGDQKCTHMHVFAECSEHHRL
jgi:hypothetical protein